MDFSKYPLCVIIFITLLLCVHGTVAYNRVCGTFDFESGNLAGWTRTGTAFNNQPTYGDNTAARHSDASGLQGHWWIGTFENRSSTSHIAGATQGDRPQGTLTSPLLRLGNSISFLIGGGSDDAVGVQVLINGQVVSQFTAGNNEGMMRVHWGDARYKGMYARIRLVDESSSPWGHVNFDDLTGDFECVLDCGTFDFETGNLAGWTRTGTAFNNQPTYSDNSAARNRETSNLQGAWWIGSFENRPSKSHAAASTQGDAPQGTLTSPSLILTGNHISFLIGGGNNMAHERVELLIDGKAVYKATGQNSETMRLVTWDVSSYKGKQARLRLIDASSEHWGHINFDEFTGDFKCDPALKECGVKMAKRIVGGQHASPGEWRWHVQLHHRRRKYQYCSGSLITPQWVITAAHCLSWQNTQDIGLTLGEHDINVHSGKEQIYGISRYIRHPQYRFPRYDFALMKLERPATLEEHVGTICLPQSTQKLPVGTVCWETGWGITRSDYWRGQMSRYLKELEVIVVDPSRHRRKITSSEFITTARTEGHGTCRGDSGGPVVHERDGRWYLEGVHSWGRPTCGQRGYVDGQADVRAVLQWIKDTIKNN